MPNGQLTQRPLPDSWVQKIFSTMLGHYGARWLNLWKLNQTLPNGEDVGVVNAMRTWAEKLGGFADHPECISRALETLPNEPPSLPQFLDMCRKAPLEQPKALEHKLTDDDIKRNKERLEKLLKQFCADKVTGDKK
jgi:hypothetical protein